jgi:translation elongation factor P/translation initiation factor 5A
MKKFIGPCMFALVLGVGMASVSYAADDTESPTPRSVEGKLLKIDGNVYVVKDQRESGKEIRLHVDKTTELKCSFEPGEKIKSEVTETNHALWIQSVKK